MVKKHTHQSIRWNTQCKHKCACGVEMVGIEPDLESWLFQHLTMSKIHRDWYEEFQMIKLKTEMAVDELWGM